MITYLDQRCDSASPRCGPCSRARQQLDCVYDATQPSRKKRDPLKKGAACIPCRRKKKVSIIYAMQADQRLTRIKRCDAVRPYCNTCQLANKEHECNYEDDVPTAARPIDPKPRKFRHFTYEKTSGTGKYTADVDPCNSSDSSASQDEEPSLTLASLAAPSEPEPSDSDSAGQPFLLSTTPLTSDAFSLDFPSPDLMNSFSTLRLADTPDPLAFALSDVSMDDMNMNLLVISLTQS